MRKLLIFGICFSFIVEIIYFNLVFDFILLILLFSTSLSLGSFFKVKVSNIDRVLISLSIGFGLLGFLLWCSTFYNFNYKSIYIVFSIFFIYLRRRYLLNYILIINRFIKNIYSLNNFLLIVILISFIFYVISASAPIQQYDSLTKHIAIPFKMLTSSNYDYNVIESIIFGDYALLPHTFYLYLLALGGTKSLVILNTILSFLILITILRISSFLYKDRVYYISITLLYLSTALIYSLSTILYVDVFPLYFVFSAYLLFQYNSLMNIKNNLFFLGLLFGFGIFTKQVAFFYIVPIILYLVVIFFKYRKQIFIKDILILIKAVVAGLFIFLPSIIVIWYKTGNPLFPFMNTFFKSEFFSTKDFFVEPFSNSVLGLNFHSLYSIVFETTKNLEMLPLGVGIYPLFAPLLFIGLFLKRERKRYLFLFLVTICSYWIAIKFSYNIRYFLGSLILLLPTSLYVLFVFLKKIKFGNRIAIIGIIFIFSIQLYTIFNSDNYFGFKKTMLVYNDKFLNLDNQSILNLIPNKSKQYILSNNDPFRGIFEGHFYVLNWHNFYLLDLLNSNILTPSDLLKQFDYYLIDKRFPLSIYTRLLDPTNLDNKILLEEFAETDTHILYKIKKESKLLSEENFNIPVEVNVENPKTIEIKNNSKYYKIDLDVEKIDKRNVLGRYQINWYDSNNNFLGTSLTPFEIRDGRNIYNSYKIENIPQNAEKGLFYLTSHDKVPIRIYGYKIFGEPNSEYLSKILNKYNKKFPHLTKD